MIRRLLVANRGEIAVRIIRAARSLDIETVAIYSDADASSLHVSLADQAICVGPAPAAQSYLNSEAIVAAAQESEADAVHPGYGFLSENAAFAKAVTKAGLIFVGPSAQVIAEMGDKKLARGIAEKAGVPVVPGFDGSNEDNILQKEAQHIGVPLMIKATAGGGGRGLRRVDKIEDFPEALHSARREAEAAFGDSGILLEKMIENARHVEVQILADNQGNTIHLFERDCSSQRRHQKVIEEAPCSTISDEVRQSLCKAATDLAASMRYSGAGTVEFLVDNHGSFYFLEMNTRLQVEHPVTEMITGIDLVTAQLKIAAGEPLGITQDEVALKGHAIEVRLYAEDPSHAFMPQTGKLGVFKIPTPQGTRLDSGVTKGDTISPYYDPMLAKMIAWGTTRTQAIEHLHKMLKASNIAGVATNKAWLNHLLQSDDFTKAQTRTHTLDSAEPFLPLPDKTQAMTVAAILHAKALQDFPNPPLAGWRTLSFNAQRRILEVMGDRFAIDLDQTRTPSGWNISVTCIGEERHFLVSDDMLKHEGHSYHFTHFQNGNMHHFDIGHHHLTVADVTHVPAERASSCGSGKLTAPMDGQVVAVQVDVGAEVKAGDLICVIEAMKMEHHIRADIDGNIDHLTATIGTQVKSRSPLASITPKEAT